MAGSSDQRPNDDVARALSDEAVWIANVVARAPKMTPEQAAAIRRVFSYGAPRP